MQNIGIDTHNVIMFVGQSKLRNAHNVQQQNEPCHEPEHFSAFFFDPLKFGLQPTQLSVYPWSQNYERHRLILPKPDQKLYGLSSLLTDLHV
jgi:hypothetical protein